MAAGSKRSLCGSCNKTVLDNHRALLCDGNCNMWWHIGCVDISKRFYELFYEIQDMKGLKWFCLKCDGKKGSKFSDSISSDHMRDSNEYAALFSIIGEELENISKNNLIMSERLSELKSENDTIKLQLVELVRNDSSFDSDTTRSNSGSSNEPGSAVNGSFSDVVKRPRPSVVRQVNGSNCSTNAEIVPHVNSALRQTNVIPNLVNGDVGTVTNDWKVVTNKKN